MANELLGTIVSSGHEVLWSCPLVHLQGAIINQSGRALNRTVARGT